MINDAFLLDTHIWLWLVSTDHTKLSSSILKKIDQYSQQNKTYISAMSIWEIAMLQAKKRSAYTYPR